MSGRKMTPKGQISRGTNSQPAVMMMPPHIRATFMPNPPIKQLPPIKNKRKHPITGVLAHLDKFEKSSPPKRITQPTPKTLKEQKLKLNRQKLDEERQSIIEEYRKFQQDCGGEYQGMNCYNTLFVGRLAYEVTERKLLREMESFGPVKDIKLVKDRVGRSRGYGFVEYENEEDMKRAYRAADGMRIEGREIVVDVERGHTVPTWLPRRLGGGLGGTRLGGKDKNVTIPGRFDPSRPEVSRPPPPSAMMMDGGPPPLGMGRGRAPFDGPPPPGPGNYGGGGGGYAGGPPGNYGPYGGYGGPPPPPSSRGGGGDRRRRRSRSRSSERGRYAPRPRY